MSSAVLITSPAEARRRIPYEEPGKEMGLRNNKVSAIYNGRGALGSITAEMIAVMDMNLRYRREPC